MPAFPTLTAALDHLSTSPRGVHYVAGEASERLVSYADMRPRSLGLLHHLQAAGARAGTHTVILVDGLAPFVDTFWACVLGRIVAVPLAPGNADEHKAKFFRVLARLVSPTLATERKVFDRLKAYAQENGLADRRVTWHSARSTSNETSRFRSIRGSAAVISSLDRTNNDNRFYGLLRTA